MIALTEDEVAALKYAAVSLQHIGDVGTADDILDILQRAAKSSKPRPPKQDSPNQGCNASRYPYN